LVSLAASFAGAITWLSTARLGGVCSAVNIVPTTATITRVEIQRDVEPADGSPDIGSSATADPNDLGIDCLSNSDANLPLKTVEMICHDIFIFPKRPPIIS
jgi:hypothetical protein